MTGRWAASAVITEAAGYQPEIHGARAIARRQLAWNLRCGLNLGDLSHWIGTLLREDP